MQRPRAAIMGIINTTPDSFSDGSRFLQTADAVNQALALVEQGADLLDIGGESTRPGAEFVSIEEELSRVIPVIERLSTETDVPISIDTYKPAVMRAALEAGASMINDVNGLRETGAIDVAVKYQVPVCLMHMQGQPKNMQMNPEYDDVVQDVLGFFKERINACAVAGLGIDKLVLDPGIGFGKTLEHNLALLKAVPEIVEQTQGKVLIGVSRKSMIDKLFARTVEQRLAASLGLAVQSVLNGAKIVRVHDVRETHDAVRAVEAVNNQLEK